MNQLGTRRESLGVAARKEGGLPRYAPRVTIKPSAALVRVLLIDSNLDQRDALESELARQGLIVSSAGDIRSAKDSLVASPPDIVVLDVDLEDLGGFGLLSTIVTETEFPVIVLTERSEEALRLLGFELGADDYVVKPCSGLELTSRMRSVLRRMDGRRVEHMALNSGDLSLDSDSRQATLAGEVLALTSREFDLLNYLVGHKGQVVDRDRILRDVWRSTSEWQDPSTVTEHVRRLRHQIEVDPTKPVRIATVRGKGYRWEG